MSSIRPEANPFVLFKEWWEEAHRTETKYPDTISLASVDADGMPDVRMVLLKEWDERGFVFYTNFQGKKGRQLLAHPKAALCLYWKSVDRQIRSRGVVERVSDAQADNYFNSRPRITRLGAWASHQSEEIADRGVLEARLREVEARYPGEDIPRPPHWSGFRLVPQEIEFWNEGAYRLHDRRVYRLNVAGGWEQVVLSP